MARFWNLIAARRDVRVYAEGCGKRYAGAYAQCGRVAVVCILTLALCVLGLAGCADEGPLAQDEGSANAPTSDEYVLASSYEEIYQAVRASLDEEAGALSAGNDNPSNMQMAASLALEEFVDEVAAEGSLTEEDLLVEFASSWDLSILVTPQNALSTMALSDIATVEDEAGYIYVVTEGTLSVLRADGSSTERVAQVSMGAYDELERWESVSALYLEGSTLAVLGTLAEDSAWNLHAPDYALSAYAASRVTVAFFDVSDPSDPEYLSALGVTGTLLGFEENDGVLTVVALRSAVPAVSSVSGSWQVVDGDEEEAEAEASDSAEAADSADADGDSDAGTDDSAATDSSAFPTRQEVIDRLELRRSDAVSYVPAVYQDGALTPLAADRVYLPADGSGAIATAVVTFDLKKQSIASGFAVYSDELEAPTVTMGTGVLYLQWASSHADEEAKTFGSSTFIMRVPLEGAALSGVAGMARVEGGVQGMLSSLSYAYEGTLFRLVQSDLTVGDHAVSGSWILQALDENLQLIGQAEIDLSEKPLGSVLFANGCVYLVGGQEEHVLSVADLSDPSSISFVDAGDASLWPESFVELEDGVLLGYGSQASYEMRDTQRVLFLGESYTSEREEATDVLRVVTLSSDGASLGEAVALGSSEDYLASVLFITPLQSANVADDLVGMVVNEGSNSAVYRIYRFSGGSLELVGEIALAEDTDTESDSETDSGEGLSGVSEYRGACLFVLDGYAYVMSFEADFATLYVCDASTLELCAKVSIEDEVLLSEE